MRLRPRHLLIAIALASAPAPAQTTLQSQIPIKAMAADAHPSFEVATIKPHDPDERDRGIWVQGDHFEFSSASVLKLLTFAYSINQQQVIGGPDWLRQARFDINGKPDAEGEPVLAQQQEMIQKLLADRFQLKFHHEQRELPVYALRIAKGGPKLAAAADPGAKSLEQSDGHDQERTLTYTSATIPYFILIEQFWVDRPLVDQTGLTGHYDFKLHYTSDEVHSTDPNAPPGLFTAIQEQLGLKFEAVKAPTDVFVIDHVERPSAN